MVRKTAGELSVKAAADEIKYNSLEVGHALTEDIAKELMECAHRHCHIFDEPKFYVCYVIAADPLIHNVMRRKFFAMLYLPSPRPNQAVFLYNKTFDRFEKRLWVLPNPATMAELSEMPVVSMPYQKMKAWSDAFFDKKFWNYIRKEHGSDDMLSEIEYLHANREKLVKAGCKEGKPPGTDPFDFSKISTNKVVNADAPVASKNAFNLAGKAKDFKGNICTHVI